MQPIIHEGSADPSIRYFNDRFYLYPSHDFAPENSEFVMYDWKVYSSENLKDWTDHGVILKGSDIAWCTLPDKCYAPDCIERDGTYFFYFCFGQEQAEIGVATASSPTGRFKDALGKPLIDKTVVEAQHIDPSCFIDDDGQAYLVWGGRFRVFIAKLKSNMIELDGPPVELTDAVQQNADTYYVEGPYLHKHDGHYYLSYHNTEEPNQWKTLGVAYAMNSGNPLDPAQWRYQGLLIDNHYQGSSQHSVIEHNGQWYCFYHAHTGNKFYRQTCVDYMYYNSDGTIQPIVPTDDIIELKNS